MHAIPPRNLADLSGASTQQVCIVQDRSGRPVEPIGIPEYIYHGNGFLLCEEPLEGHLLPLPRALWKALMPLKDINRGWLLAGVGEKDRGAAVLPPGEGPG